MPNFRSASTLACTLAAAALLNLACSNSSGSETSSTSTSGGSGSANVSSGGVMTSCPMGATLCSGLCVNTERDEDNCGECGTVCATGEVCTAGDCVLNCPSGFIACNGRCVNPSNDLSFCGATGACTGATAGETCAPGEVCDMGQCELNCGTGLVACNNTCTDPRTDEAHCGAAGDCTGQNAGAQCTGGQVCNMGTCRSDCSAPLITCGGRCVDPQTDRMNCGAAGDCTGANDGTICSAGQECTAGVCQINCPNGQILCGSTCVNPVSDRSFCGAAGNCVSTPGEACDTGEICDNGACRLVCPSSQVACNGSCVDPSTDERFCGASGNCTGFAAGAICPNGQSCDNGQCRLVCPSGQVNCNNTCVNPMTDLNFCGAAGDCQGGNAGSACQPGFRCNGMGQCALNCQTGFVACGGACIDPQTDEQFCGASGSCSGATDGNIRASGLSCVDGQCQLVCPSGQIACNGGCIDPTSDETYCGATGNCVGANDGNTCMVGQACVSGQCVLACPSGQINCGGSCVNPQTNPMFCGATGNCMGANAGTSCAAGFACNGSGQCTLSCQAGLVNCGGQCINPQTDRNFCGASGTCTGANDGTTCLAGQVCSAGTCATSCPAGTLTCGGTCVNPLIDRNYCGATGNCMGTNDGNMCAANQICQNGACVNSNRIYVGSLTPTTGRWTYQSVVGTDGAVADCRARFGAGMLTCTYQQLQAAQAQSELINPVDHTGAAVNAWWIDDATTAGNRRCVNTAAGAENIPWSYQTGHLGVGGYYATVNRAAGTLNALILDLTCRETSRNVACCNP